MISTSLRPFGYINIMKKLYIFLSVILLSGCWDYKLLRDSRIAYSIALDLQDKNRLKGTVEVVTSIQNRKSEIHSAVDLSAQEISDRFRTNVTGDIHFSMYKNQLFGNEFAQKGFFPSLDVAYRDQYNPTAEVKIIIVDGNASEVLKKKKIGEMLIGEFLKRKVKNLENRSYLPNENLETIFRKNLDEGEDFALPSIKLQGEEIISNGLALFHHDKMTGVMPLKKCTLFVLMTGRPGKLANLAVPLKNNGRMTIQTHGNQISHKKRVVVHKNGKIDVYIRLKMKVVVLQFPSNHLNSLDRRKTITSEISKNLTNQSKEITKRLQQANCDAFGVGRQLIAYHPEEWKKFDLKKIKFHTKVDVTILNSGVLY